LQIFERRAAVAAAAAMQQREERAKLTADGCSYSNPWSEVAPW